MRKICRGGLNDHSTRLSLVTAPGEHVLERESFHLCKSRCVSDRDRDKISVNEHLPCYTCQCLQRHKTRRTRLLEVELFPLQCSHHFERESPCVAQMLRTW